MVGLATIILMLGSVSAVLGRESQGIRHAIAQHDNALLSTLLLASGVATGLRASVTLVDERVRRTIELSSWRESSRSSWSARSWLPSSGRCGPSCSSFSFSP